MAEKEYIERDSIYSRVKTRTNPYGKPTLDYKSGVQVLDMIMQEPAADVVEVRHGGWIDACYGELQCSVCGIIQEEYPHRYNYCPNCGAKMDGGANE